MNKFCVNCPGSTDHDTADCPLFNKSELVELCTDLRAIAEKATPGEWWIDSHGHTMVSFTEGKTHTIFVAKDLITPAVRHPETGNLSHWPNDWDASFIATASPANILTILDATIHTQALIAEKDARIAELEAEREILVGKIICCGVAATHSDPELTTTGAYAKKWDSQQSAAILKVRLERDKLRDELAVAPAAPAADAGLVEALERIATSAALHVEKGMRPDLVSVAHWAGVADAALAAHRASTGGDV